MLLPKQYSKEIICRDRSPPIWFIISNKSCTLHYNPGRAFASSEKVYLCQISAHAVEKRVFCDGRGKFVHFAQM